MKRRESITTAAAALTAIPVVAQAADRRFGIPGSIAQGANRTRKLHLKLSRAEMPISVWDDIERIEALWANVATSPDLMAKFRQDPKSVLRMYGLDDSVLSGRDRESRVMAAVCDLQVQDAVSRRDYIGFLQLLQSKGVMTEGLESSGLVNKIAEIFARDKKKYHVLIGKAIDGRANDDLMAVVWAVFDVAVAVYALAVVAAVVVGLTSDDNPMLRATATLTPDRLELLADADRVARLIGNKEVGAEVFRMAIKSEISAIIQAAIIAGIADLRGLSQEQIVDRIAQRIAHVSV